MHPINFKIDTEYMLEKACTFYSRKPYINSSTVYCYVDYYDKHIETFLGNAKVDEIIVRKDGSKKLDIPHRVGLGKIIATRIEWRWEYNGPRSFPRGAKTVIDWNLRDGSAHIINLKTASIKTIQPEQIYYSVYGSLEYDKCVEQFESFWGKKRKK
jgi:hypothetical protein